MAVADAQLTSEERSLVKGFARRRVFVFFYVVTAIAFVSVVAGGEDGLGPIDDYAKVLISVAIIALIAVTWKNQTLKSMKRTNMIATIAGVLLILFGIMAIVVENSSDAADDFPAIILGIFLVINGVL